MLNLKSIKIRRSANHDIKRTKVRTDGESTHAQRRMSLEGSRAVTVHVNIFIPHKSYKPYSLYTVDCRLYFLISKKLHFMFKPLGLAKRVLGLGSAAWRL